MILDAPELVTVHGRVGDCGFLESQERINVTVVNGYIEHAADFRDLGAKFMWWMSGTGHYRATPGDMS